MFGRMGRSTGRIAAVGLVLCAGAMAQQAKTAAHLTAAQIAEKNVAARGGLQRWRNVQALVVHGEMEAGGNRRPTLAIPGPKNNKYMPPARPVDQVRLPFLMELKRPLKSRVEVTFQGKPAVQVYDGASGWKLRPFLNRHDVEPYTPDELKIAAKQFELDGPLVDYAAKGSTLELVGAEKVGTQDTYKLQLTRKSGEVTHLWVDATTFLEVKIEGSPRRLDGRERPVEVFYRDYRNVDGLQIPFVLETRVLSGAGPIGQSGAATEQMVVSKVDVNPKLDDTLFTRGSLEVAATTATTGPAQASVGAGK